MFIEVWSRKISNAIIHEENEKSYKTSPPPPKPQFPLHPYQHYTYEIRLPMVNGKSTPEYSYVMF